MVETNKKLILFMPSMEGGGVEKNIILITNYLAKHLDKVDLITFDKKFNSKFSKKICIHNIIRKKGYCCSKYYKYFRCILILIKEIIIDKNVVLFSFQANIYSIIVAKIFGIKVISRSNSSPSGWTKNPLKNFIFKFFFKFTDQIIVNSFEFKKQLDKKFSIKSKVIYNPLNIKEIKNKSKKKINFNFFKEKKTLKLINIGRLTDQKDHFTLLKAFKIIEKNIKTKLLIIGYGTNKKKILEFIKINKLKHKIKLLGFKENPFPYLKQSDALILSSIYEGLPNVILEAISLKKFVISSSCPTGPKEILKNGKYGLLFKPGNEIALGKKILDYKYRQKKYAKTIKKAYINLDRFNFQKNCQEYLKIVRKFI